jgi:hypothetical protein
MKNIRIVHIEAAHEAMRCALQEANDDHILEVIMMRLIGFILIRGKN